MFKFFKKIFNKKTISVPVVKFEEINKNNRIYKPKFMNIISNNKVDEKCLNLLNEKFLNEKIFNEVVKRNLLKPHPIHKGRYILPDRKGSITRHSKEFILSEKMVEYGKENFKNLKKYFELMLSVYIIEARWDFDKKGNPIDKPEKYIFIDCLPLYVTPREKK